MKSISRVLSVLLCAAMLLTMAPLSGFATAADKIKKAPKKDRQNPVSMTESVGDVDSLVLDPSVSVDEINYYAGNTEEELRMPIEQPQETEPEVDGELVEINQYSKIYQTGERTYTAVYGSTPNYFVNDEGEAQEYDNSLTLDAGKNAAFTNAAGDIDVRLSTDLAAKGMTFDYNNVKIGLTPVEGNYDTYLVVDDAVRYSNVFDGIDVQYTVGKQGVSEDIILTKEVDKNSFSYKLNLNGHYAEIVDNVLFVFDKKGDAEYAYTVSAPIMTDAAGITCGDILLSIDGDILTITANAEWLHAIDRAYPVAIDPEVTIPADSLYFRTGISGNNGVIYAAPGYAFAGKVDGYVNTYNLGLSKTIIGIADNALDSIPEDSKIVDAYLHIYQYTPKSSTSTVFNISYVNSPWNIADFYYNSPNGLERINNLDVQYLSRSASLVDGWHAFDIREAVNGWHKGIIVDSNGNKINKGLVLSAEDNNITGGAFAPSDPANTSVTSKTPWISVTWEIPNPVDPDYDINNTTINLRTIGTSSRDGKLAILGVFADGVAKPYSVINYQFSDSSAENQSAQVPASPSYKYPDSSAWDEAFATAGRATRYKDLLSNWQTSMPFTQFNYNQLYYWNATATKDGVTGNTAKSVDFLVYKITRYDTLHTIANYYGVSVDSLARDNHVQDMLLVENNTIIVINPTRNAITPYNPAPLTDAEKMKIDGMLMGRNKHCEFGFEPVNLNSGNFYMQQTDVSIPDFNGDFAIARDYNSKGAGINSVFGRGWQFEYAETLAKPTVDTFAYHRGDGSTINFYKQSDSLYTSENGYYMTLTPVKVGTAMGDFGGEELEEYDIFEYEITMANGEVRRFSSRGLLTKITDEKGFVTSIAYDANNNFASITSPAGQVYTITSANDGKIKSVALPNGKSVSYTYSGDDLVGYTNELGYTVTYNYDANHLMTSWADAEGNVIVTNVYDAEGRVTKQTDANGADTLFAYGDHTTTTTDAEGNVTKYYYDNLYRTTKIEYADGTTETKTYDAANNLASVTDRNGKTTSYTYNAAGYMLTEKRFDNAVKTYTYNAKNDVTKIVDFDGLSTSYAYDAKRNVTSATAKDGTVTAYEFDANCRMTKQTDANGKVTRYAYDGIWVSSITNAENAVEQYYYDTMGHVVTKIDALGNQTRYMYDAAGRNTGYQTADDKTVTYTYDKAGCMTSLKNAAGYVYSYEYDGMGNIVTLTDPLGNAAAFTYDGLYNTTSTAYDADHVTASTFDAFSRPLTETDEEGNVVSYTYDGVGNVLTKTDAKGNVTTYTYDLRFNKPLTVTDALGGVTTYAYDNSGNLISVTDAKGNVTTYTYDNVGNLLTVTNPNGRVDSYQYDNAGHITEKKIGTDDVTTYSYNNVYLPTSVTYANGAKLLYTYDALGNKLTETDSAGATTTFTYDVMNRVATKEDGIGRKTTYTYDANGNVLKEEYSNGGSTTFVYDALDRLCKKTDGLNNSTIYAYDAVGNLTSVTDALANVTTYAYTKTGLVASVTDPLGGVTKTEYDANGNTVKTTDANGNVVSMTYDALNRLATANDTTGLQKTFTYDAIGNLVKEADNQGVETSYVYDAMGNLVKTVDPLGNETTYTFDKKDRLTSVKDAENGVSGFTYDVMGNLLSVTDANGNSEAYTYDIVGNRLTETDALGGVTSYNYDKVGRVTANTNAKDLTTQYQYNDFDFVTETTDPDGNTENKTYDIVGNLTSETDKNGNRTQYTYNAIYQLVKVTFADGSTNAFAYDANGNLTKKTDANGSDTVYAYDAVGNCVSITDPEGGVYSYTYDANGSVLTATDPNGNVTAYTYDLSYGNLASETDALSGVTAYTYDARGQLIKKTDANGNDTSYTYDKVGNVITVTYPGGLKHTFTYDNVGNVLTDKTNVGDSTSFTYDANYNNLSVTYTNGAKLIYTYDALGNRLSEKDSLDAVTTYAYDNLNRNTSVTDAIGRTVTYAYDPNGNVMTQTASNGGVTSYTYDAKNRVTSITDALDHTTALTYDGEGNLLTSTDARGAVTAYTYTKTGLVKTATDPLGAKTTMEYDPVGNMTKVTDAEGFVATVAYDALNRTSSMTDALGLVKNYTYDAIGNLTADSDNNGSSNAYTYSPAGYLTKVVDALGNATVNAYDLKGQLTQVTDANSAVTKYAYDSMGHLTSMTDAEGGVTAMEYDIVGNNTKQTDANGGVYTFSYDKAGRVLKSVDPLGFTTQYSYNDFDLVTKTIDANGNASEKQYDIGGNLTATIDANGHKTSYAYDETYNLTKVTYADHTANSFAYDLNGSLIKATDGNGNASTFAYNKLGYRTSETDAKGNVTVYTRNANGDPLTETDALGHVTTYAYDKSGRLVSQTLANGAVYSFDYDALGRPVKQTLPEGQFDVFTYDGVGNTTLVTDETDRQTAYTYDKLGRLLTSTDAKGNRTAFAYDKLGNLVAMTTPNGNTTTYTYDANSRLASTAAPETALLQYSYDNVGNLISTDEGGRVTGFSYDKAGNLTSETNALGKVRSYTYDELDRMVKETDFKGNDTRYTYDANDNLTSVTNRLGEQTTYEYDKNNNLTGTVDAANRDVVYYYNELNWLTAVKEGGVLSAYEYDAVGNLTKAGGYTYTYNLNGDILTATNAIGNVTEYVYNQNGMLAQTVNADKTTVNYDYDEIDELVAKTYDDGEQAALFAYDADGNRVSMTDLAGVTDYEYDDAGRVTAIILYNGVSRVTYKYNEFGEVTELGYPDATKVTYAYDDLGRLVEMTDRDGGVVTYAYDDNGNLTEVHRANETWTKIEYDDEDHVTAIENYGYFTIGKWHLKSVLSSKYTYSYDGSGNIVSEGVYEYVTECSLWGFIKYLFTRLKNEHIETNYTYDGRNQLVGVNESKKVWFNRTTTHSTSYQYDLSGNRTKKVCDGEETVYTYNEAGQLLSETTGKSSLLQLPGSDDTVTVTYTYDENGNLISETSPACLGKTAEKTYEYDNENRLKAVKENGTLLMAMLYDGDGIRTFTAEKTEKPCQVIKNAFELGPIPGSFNQSAGNSGSDSQSAEADKDIYDLLLVPNGVDSKMYAFYDLTEYINNVNTEYAQVLLERAADSKTKAVYEYGMFRERAEIDGTDYTYEYDGRGSVIALTTANAKKVTTYAYDEFGVTTSAGQCVENPYQYNAEYTDDLTGMQYLRARYYRAQTGSFITTDTYTGRITAPLSLNRYTYVHNNPIISRDPSGHFVITTALIIGLAIVDVGLLATDAALITKSVAKKKENKKIQEIKQVSDKKRETLTSTGNTFKTVTPEYDFNSTKRYFNDEHYVYDREYNQVLYFYNLAEAQMYKKLCEEYDSLNTELVKIEKTINTATIVEKAGLITAGAGLVVASGGITGFAGAGLVSAGVSGWGIGTISSVVEQSVVKDGKITNNITGDLDYKKVVIDSAINSVTSVFTEGIMGTKLINKSVEDVTKYGAKIGLERVAAEGVKGGISGTISGGVSNTLTQLSEIASGDREEFSATEVFQSSFQSGIIGTGGGLVKGFVEDISYNLSTKSNRGKTVGATPQAFDENGNLTKTGKEMVERGIEDGTVIDLGNEKYMFYDKTKKEWYDLTKGNVNMGHNIDASGAWQFGLYKEGTKSNAAKEFMNDLNNYSFELPSSNKSNGAKLPFQYKLGY